MNRLTAPRRQASSIPSSYAMQNTFLRGCARGSESLHQPRLENKKIRRSSSLPKLIAYILIYTTNIYKCTELVRRGCKPANTLSDFPISSSGLLRITNQIVCFWVGRFLRSLSSSSSSPEAASLPLCWWRAAAYGRNGGTPL